VVQIFQKNSDSKNIGLKAREKKYMRVGKQEKKKRELNASR